MKKIAFALQVFALITILPLYVMMEINHARITRTENNVTMEVSAKAKNIPAIYSQAQTNRKKV